MPTIEINDLASIGVIRDTPAYQLPPEAWSTVENMRVVNGGLERLLGWTQVFGTPPVAPHFTVPMTVPTGNFWVYTSLTKAYVYDGTNHTEITRVASDYNASEGADWNSTILGGILILNNGTDVPQFWGTVSAATKLLDLTNWPAGWTAKVVRALGPYLIAIHPTKSGTVYPHLINWSHPADPGSVPVSWDVTDPTRDAGQNDLPDVNSGVLMDALPLQSIMYLYKEGSIWAMRPIGGRFIFDFKTFLETTGILAPRCVAVTGDGLRHVVATQDDIIWHNGNTAQSILNKKLKRALFNEIDTTNYGNSFMFPNPAYNEVWFCYPAQGQIYPNRAIIWNYSDSPNGVVTEAVGINFRHAATGSIEVASDLVWADASETWEEKTGPWSEVSRRRVVICDTANTKLHGFDRGVTRDGAAFTVTLQREGLAVVGRTRNGDWIVDFEKIKMISRMWPKITGGPINVRVGVQSTVDGPITWGNAVEYNPSVAVPADFTPMSGRAVAIEFSTTASVQWRIDGYKPDITVLGNY